MTTTVAHPVLSPSPFSSPVSSPANRHRRRQTTIQQGADVLTTKEARVITTEEERTNVRKRSCSVSVVLANSWDYAPTPLSPTAQRKAATATALDFDHDVDDESFMFDSNEEYKDYEGDSEEQTSDVGFRLSDIQVEGDDDTSKLSDEQASPSIHADYLEQADEGELLWEADPTTGIQKVVAGSVDRLVRLLAQPPNSTSTGGEAPDEHFLQEFLWTFTYFITSTELVHKLLSLYMATKRGEDATETTARRIRILQVLKEWISGHFYTFEKEPIAITQLEHFFEHVVSSPTAETTLSDAVSDLRKRLAYKKRTSPVFNHAVLTPTKVSRRLSMLFPPGMLADVMGGRHNAINQPGAGPTSTLPAHIDGGVDNLDMRIVDIHPVEIARQLTMIEWRIFASISPGKDLKHKAWQRSENFGDDVGTIDNTVALNSVKRMARHANRVIFWTATEVVSTPNLRQRATVLARLIDVGVELRRHGNFHGVMEVVGGLNHSSVQRLKQTWQALSAKHRQRWQGLEQLMSGQDNYRCYRDELAASVAERSPVIPFLGRTMADLLFMEENAATVPSPQGDKAQRLVNFAKLRMIARMLSDIHRMQAIGYQFEDIPALQQYILSFPVMSEDQLHQFSKRCEGRWFDRGVPRNADAAASAAAAGPPTALPRRKSVGTALRELLRRKKSKENLHAKGENDKIDPKQKQALRNGKARSADTIDSTVDGFESSTGSLDSSTEIIAAEAAAKTLSIATANGSNLGSGEEPPGAIGRRRTMTI